MDAVEDYSGVGILPTLRMSRSWYSEASAPVRGINVSVFQRLCGGCIVETIATWLGVPWLSSVPLSKVIRATQLFVQ